MDDEPYNVLGLQLTISRLGIKGLASQVDRAYNGMEAFEKVKKQLYEHKITYGFIITDISMPIMDGYELS